MIDPKIQRYLDAPIDTAERASKVWLPEGRKKALPPIKEQPPAALVKRARERKESAEIAKMDAVLRYYAGTEIPLDRIAAHTGLTLDQARQAMINRGRNIEGEEA